MAKRKFDITRDAIVSDGEDIWFVPAGQGHLRALRLAVAELCDVKQEEIAWTRAYMRPDSDGEEGRMEVCRENDPEAVAYFAVGDVGPGVFDVAGHAISAAHTALEDVLGYIRANGDADSHVAREAHRAVARLERAMPRAKVEEMKS